MPTALLAIVASPLAAMLSATRNGAVCILPPPPVAEDDRRPALCRSLASRQEKLEGDLVLALDGWHTRARANRRNELLRRLIAGRAILPECECTHRTTHRECPQENLDSGKGRRIYTHLLVEQNAGHRAAREYRPDSLWPEQEIRRLGDRGLELIADLF